jgi:phage terminase large subunit-like protein
MTAVVFGFPPESDGEPWKLLPFFWIPQEKVPDFERVCRVPIRSWIERGFVEQTPGNAYDLRVVRDRILWGRQMFDIQELAYDRTNFRNIAMAINDEDGITAIEVPQNFMQLSAPTKFLLAAYLDQKIAHGNNPVYNWHAACLQVQYDRKDNVQPAKPERLKSSKRIDGIQATVTMLNRGVAAPAQQYTSPQVGWI